MCHIVKGVLKDCTNIGNEIEKYVQDSNIGADAWRRTGILTFNSNKREKKKEIYELIRQHLMKVYKHSFSFGCIVEIRPEIKKDFRQCDIKV